MEENMGWAEAQLKETGQPAGDRCLLSTHQSRVSNHGVGAFGLLVLCCTFFVALCIVRGLADPTLCPLYASSTRLIWTTKIASRHC